MAPRVMLLYDGPRFELPFCMSGDIEARLSAAIFQSGTLDLCMPAVSLGTGAR